MTKKELAKFFSGFFAFSLFATLLLLLGGFIPFRFLNIAFDFSLWTIVFLFSLFLAVFFAFAGWSNAEAKKIVISLLFIFISSSFFLNQYFIDILKSYTKAEIVSIIEEKEEISLVSTELASQSKTFTLQIGAEKNDFGKAIAVDENNNVYTTGYFQGTIDLDLSEKVLEKTSIGGSINDSAIDIYVAKYNPLKELMFTFAIGSVGADVSKVIKLDQENNFYLAGYFGGQIDFDPSSKEALFNAGIGRDAFLAKYDKDGNFKWANVFGNPETIPFTNEDKRFEEIYDLVIDDSSNVYIIGAFDGEVIVNGAIYKSNGKRDVLIVKYDKDGQYLNGFSFGSISNDEGKTIAVNSDGIYVAGSLTGKITFNKAATFPTAGSNDIFIAKYDSDFNCLWAKSPGGAGFDDVNGIVLDGSGNVFVAGVFSNSFDFNGQTVISKGLTDVFLAKYDKEGKLEFVKTFGGELADKANAINKDNNNNVYIAGSFKGTVDFNPGLGKDYLFPVSSLGASDIFLAKYSGQGEYLWARSFGGEVSLTEESQSAEGIAFDNENNPLITGGFWNAVDFHSTNGLNLKSKGNSDAFIVKYNTEGEIE